MAQRKSSRAIQSILAIVFAGLVAATVGSVVFLLLVNLLAAIELPAYEANYAAGGVGIFVAGVCFLIQLWRQANRRVLRPRRLPSAMNCERPPDSD